MCKLIIRTRLRIASSKVILGVNEVQKKICRAEI